MGSIEPPYKIQSEAEKIFYNTLLPDPRLQLPFTLKDVVSRTKFDETAIQEPFIPSPVKMTESITSLWALGTTISNLICKERYGIDQEAIVNSDVASLFLMSSGIVKVGGKGSSDPEIARRWMPYVTGKMFMPWRRLATNIYPTKDNRWFHLHGSMNATPTQDMLGFAHTSTVTDEDEIIAAYTEAMKKHDSQWWDIEASEHYRQAGTICLTPEEYKQSEQGRVIEDDGLYLMESTTDTLPVPWPQTAATTTYRPLEGIKIIEVARVIAAPTITKTCALHGATVIRISCTSQPDMGPLLLDGNLGKRDVTLDLKSRQGKDTLKQLLQDADVFLDGYRPGALEKLGFGPAYVMELARRRGKGIVYIRENTYGWRGPMAMRSGWQQISDCFTGVSWLQGKFLGLNEPVVPLLPNSDYQTGFAGFIGILCALHKRESVGGSHLVSVSLDQFNSWMISLGTYSQEMEKILREKNKDLHLRSYDDMIRLVSKTLASLKQAVPQLFSKKYFSTMPANLGGPEGETMEFVGPAAIYDKTILKYDVGSCLLGAYEPKWPET